MICVNARRKAPKRCVNPGDSPPRQGFYLLLIFPLVLPLLSFIIMLITTTILTIGILEKVKDLGHCKLEITAF